MSVVALPSRPGETAPASRVVLEVKDLVTHFPTRTGVVKAVDGVSFAVAAGERAGRFILQRTMEASHKATKARRGSQFI